MIRDAAILLVELTALFFGVSFLVQLAQRRAGSERIRAWMGGSSLTAAVKGIAVGAMTPFCTYSAIPMLVGLRQAGVPPAGYVAFIVAAPVLDPILFGALILIVGFETALVYVGVAVVAALALALIADRSGIERHLKPMPAVLSGQPVPATITIAPGAPREHPAASCDRPAPDQAWRGLRAESPDAARKAISLLRTLAPLMLTGVAIGVAITALVSPEMTAEIASRAGPLAIPASAAMGTPLYFNTELFVPIADALRGAGVTTGPIVALTIAGAGANLPEFVILSRLARKRLLVTFVAYVFAIAVTGGLLTQAVSA